MSFFICRLIFAFFVLTALMKGELLALSLPRGPVRVFMGPEVYHSKRTKEGGSEQTGWLLGGRGLAEMRKHGGLYLALEGYYASGRLCGHTASHKKLKSDLTDKEIEGRAGYAFCVPSLRKLTLIPYGGYGVFESVNDFKKPSPLPFEFRTHFTYTLCGIEISMKVKPCWECCLNVKKKFMTEGKCTIKNDPEYDKIRLMIENEPQYEVDLVARYYGCINKRNVAILFGPFYRTRHYGGKANVPFDFIDTKFKIYGLKIMAGIAL